MALRDKNKGLIGDIKNNTMRKGAAGFCRRRLKLTAFAAVIWAECGKKPKLHVVPEALLSSSRPA